MAPEYQIFSIKPYRADDDKPVVVEPVKGVTFNKRKTSSPDITSSALATLTDQSESIESKIALANNVKIPWVFEYLKQTYPNKLVLTKAGLALIENNKPD